MFKLLKYFKSYKLAIFGALLLLFIQVMTDLALPNYMAGIINKGIIPGNLPFILSSGVQMLAIALAGAACATGVGYLASRIAAKSSMHIREDVFKKVTDFANPEFDQFSTASLVTRSTNDIQQIQMIVVLLFRMVFMAPIMGVGALIMAYRTSPSMTWTIALALVLVLIMMIGIFTLSMPRFKRLQKLVDKLNLVMNERLTGILVIRAFNTEGIEEERFDQTNTQLTNLNLFINRIMVMMMPMMMLIMNGVSILILWTGAKKIDTKLLEIGNLLEFIQYAMLIIMSFMMMSMVFIMLPRALVSATRVAEVLGTTPTITDPTSDVLQSFDDSSAARGVVEFKNVSFKYPDADENVLENINFTAQPGEITAFIGSTGSGKSTLINLIPRFYDATEGEILIGGINIKHIKQKELRDKIGYVPQKALLFSGTIEENILYGEKFVDGIDEDTLRGSADTAQAMDFINDKPEGFKTAISQGGTNVSGGQKQRLSIARALAIKPEIFIFDDSFSALDYKTDLALRRALKETTGNSTILIVAQRISTIKNAEQIIVLDEGVVVGKGTHEHLMSTCSVYKEIASSQLEKEVN